MKYELQISSAELRGLLSIKQKVPLQKQRYFEIDNELISLRTVRALIKQSCGLFLAMTAAAELRGLLSMKIKKVPMRTCVVSGEKCEKRDLLRVVRNNEGLVFVDDTLKANGRGAYLKKDKDVIEKARKTKVLERHLDVKIDDNIYDELLTKI